MEARELGKTGLQVSCLAFDSSPLQSLEFNDAQRLLNAAYYAGITLYSTGRGDVDSEIKLSYGVNLRRHDVAVLAKTEEREGQKVTEAIDRSMRNLHTDCIDIYQLDNVVEAGELELSRDGNGTFEAIEEAKASGKIRYASVSSFRPSVLEGVISSECVDVVEFPVNIFDLDYIQKVGPLAKERGLGVIGSRPFAAGAFGDPTMALPFALDQDISAVMTGMHTIDHVRQNCGVVNNFAPLSEAERERLFETARNLGRDYCRFCGECATCPQGLDVPGIFELLRASWRFHLRDWARQTYETMSPKPNVCDKCGACEEKCPYGVNVISLLERAANHFA